MTGRKVSWQIRPILVNKHNSRKRGSRVAGDRMSIEVRGTHLSELGLLLAVGHMMIALQIAVHHLVWEYAGI